MTTTIETEHGSFFGETLAEATRRARQAARTAKRREADRNAAHESAADYAMRGACRVYDAIARFRRENIPAPPTWAIVSPRDAGIVIERDPLMPRYSVAKWAGCDWYTYRGEIVGALVDACGPFAVIERRDGAPDAVLAIGIGTCRDEKTIATRRIEIDAAELYTAIARTINAAAE